ncbi:methionine aminopeptidase [Flexivirga sp. ID2601S]|uniref:Methionine aminopeptidase n=1 Tax=Flexivirga aerilata TaxID=1656889 RepID=A0A849ALD1_9MICO|nr:methionine aminopeptidase [Flexivirga aerilata]
MAYWFNVDTRQVEKDGETDPKAKLLGPYDSEDEARNALESARERTEEWDKADKEWNEG